MNIQCAFVILCHFVSLSAGFLAAATLTKTPSLFGANCYSSGMLISLLFFRYSRQFLSWEMFIRSSNTDFTSILYLNVMCLSERKRIWISTASFCLIYMNYHNFFTKNTEIISCCLFHIFEFGLLFLLDWMSTKARESSLINYLTHSCFFFASIEI